MINYLPLLLTLLFLDEVALAQRGVSNVKTRAINQTQLEITYTLDAFQPGDSLYFLVESRFGGALTVKRELVSGDVGTNLTPGPNKKINWRIAENGYILNGEIRATVFIKPQSYTGPILPKTNNPIVINASDSSFITKKSYQTAPETSLSTGTKPADSTKTTKPREWHYSPGPGWALVSAVLPGVGNMFVQKNQQGKVVPKVGLRPLVTVGFYGLLVYGLQQRNLAKVPYETYKQQKNAIEGEPFYNEANRFHHRYYIATRTAAVLWVTDLALTMIKGINNSKQKSKRNVVTLLPGYYAGYPVAVCRLTL